MLKDDTTRAARSASDAWTLGVQLAVLLGGCTLGGWYFGRKTDAPGLWLGVGALTGLLLNLYEVWKWCRTVPAVPPAGAHPGGRSAGRPDEGDEP